MRFNCFCVFVAIGQLVNVLAVPTFLADEEQRPLGSTKAATSRGYRVLAQTDSLCDAGSRQWTGWVNVSDEKKIFFWFFESRSLPQQDPVVVWLNGGPGGSSLVGMFDELGPCSSNEFGNGTLRNEHTWTNFANVLFVDQPAGVGFSSINNGTVGGVDNLAEAAQDFDKFLATFFNDVFPEFSHQPFHITGESFAGTYIPGIVDYIGRRQQLGVPGVFQIPIQSITLVDALMDIMGSRQVGMYDHMCRFDEDGNNLVKTGYNATVCRAIEKAVPECERLHHHCQDTYDLDICKAASTYCEENIEIHLTGKHFAYDDRMICNGTQPLCQIFSRFEEYLNGKEVQNALGIEGTWNYSIVNWDLGKRWTESKNEFRPTTREMEWVLDESPIKVLVLNGNNDIIVNTEGQKRALDSLHWNRQASFRLKKFTDWSWLNKSGKLTKGGEFKSVDKLAFFTVDEAGHTSPGDQREAIGFLMKCWMTGGKDDACPIKSKVTKTSHFENEHVPEEAVGESGTTKEKSFRPLFL